MGFAAEQRDAMECVIRAGGSFMAAVPLAHERGISKPYLRTLMYHKTKYAEKRPIGAARCGPVQLNERYWKCAPPLSTASKRRRADSGCSP